MVDARLDFWRRRLTGVEPLELPTGPRRRAERIPTARRYAFAIPAGLIAGARALAEQRDVSPVTVPLAAYQVLLGAYCRQEDLAVGVRLAGGGGGGGARTLVARVDLGSDPVYGELLEQLDSGLREALVEPKPDWDLARGAAGVSPLHAWFADVAALDGVAYQVALSTRLDGVGGEGLIEYDPGLFDPSMIERMAGHWLSLLTAAVAAPDRRISAYDLLTEAERHRVLVRWSRAPREYPPDVGLDELFREQVAARPDAVAVEFGGARMTYAQLDERAGRLARLLRSRGAGPGVLVGLCVERGPDLVISLLAVLRAGSAYVPLDPEFPSQRLAFMVRDTGMPLVLTQARLRERISIPNHAVIRVDDLPDTEPGGGPAPGPTAGLGHRDGPAYVLYTSGSTGAPKGVLVSRASLVNLLFAMRDNFALRPGDGVLFSTSVTFDIAQVEVFLPLITGGRIVLADTDQARSPAALATLIARHGVVLAQATPSAWRPLLEALRVTPGVPGLEICTAGEALPAELARTMLDVAIRVVNGYGPTETTIFATMAEVGDPDTGVTIGRPTANTEVFVVDLAGRPVPVGVPGELLIGGRGVAIGYLNRPELTAERFVPHPFSADPSARVYRTGDLVRWRGDGELEFLGRLDHQVKVRGFRIEPGEIEAVLGAHPDVASCVVVARADVPGGNALVAYYVPVPPRALEVSALREWCGRVLPGYLVPSAFVFLPALPLTTSGKVNRGALPAPDGEHARLAEEYSAPRTPAERAVARIWAEALWLDRVGAHDDFFDLGGDSLIATRVALLLGRELGLDVPVKALFDRSTVEGLAELLTAARRRGGVFPTAVSLDAVSLDGGSIQ